MDVLHYTGCYFGLCELCRFAYWKPVVYKCAIDWQLLYDKNNIVVIVCILCTGAGRHLQVLFGQCDDAADTPFYYLIMI